MLTLTDKSGHSVQCHGDLNPTDALAITQITCLRDSDSGAWYGGDPINGAPFRNWAEAVKIICAHVEGTVTALEVL